MANDLDGITANNIREFAALLGRDMHAVRQLAAILGQDIHDLRKRFAEFAADPIIDIQPINTIINAKTFFDPFNTPQPVLSLPLPIAFNHISAALSTHYLYDHLIILISDNSLEGFYKKALSASKDYPDFFNTAVNLQQRYGFASSPALSYKKIIIRAGEGIGAIADWINSYDQVYSVVLLLRFESGQLKDIN